MLLNSRDDFLAPNPQHQLRIFVPRPKIGGSVEHFAHFFLDYFIDIVVSVRDYPNTTFIVRECGPCTPWLHEVARKHPLVVVAKEDLLVLAKQFPQQTQVVPGEYVKGWNRSRLDFFRWFLGQNVPPSSSRYGVIAERRRIHPFYSSAQTELAGSGPSRRSIKNQTLLSLLLELFFGSTNVDFINLTPAQAMSQMSVSNFLIAQRGAALMNLIFLPPGATVVEILPQSFNSPGKMDLYHDLCDALGFEYRRVRQSGSHSRVGISAVLWALARGLLSERFRRGRRVLDRFQGLDVVRLRPLPQGLKRKLYSFAFFRRPGPIRQARAAGKLSVIPWRSQRQDKPRNQAGKEGTRKL